MDDALLEGLADHADALRTSDDLEGLAEGLELGVVYDRLPSGVYGLRAVGLVIVTCLRDPARRMIVGVHECAHDAMRSSRLSHCHADVWVLTLAMAAPRRMLEEHRASIGGPVDLAAVAGIPWWAAALRLEMPSVSEWLRAA